VDEDTRKARLVLELRRAGVTDGRVMQALEELPRSAFVYQSLAAHGDDDAPVPMACGQAVLSPRLVGIMTQALHVGERMKVLEIGTGSGFQTAVLARLCRRVYSLERHRPLLRAAEARWRERGLYNITARAGDGRRGWPEQAPFPRILVTAAAATPPPALLEQLGEDGVLVIAEGEGEQTLCLYRRTAGGIVREAMRPLRFVPMIEGGDGPP